MRVVLAQNLERDEDLFNGSQGKIIGFNTCDEKQLSGNTDGFSATGSGPPRLDGHHAGYRHLRIKQFVEDNKQDGRPQPWPLVKFDNGRERTVYADCAVEPYGQEAPYSLLSRSQIPLIAGYAMTIHKSQVRLC
jgi:ATP-dependent DNA helicase PIF1